MVAAFDSLSVRQLFFKALLWLAGDSLMGGMFTGMLLSCEGYSASFSSAEYTFVNASSCLL